MICGLTVLIMSGCHARVGVPTGSSNNPVVGAVAGVEGLADAVASNKDAQQKAKQASVNEYLEKASKK